jgi:hypothetical protein
LATSQEARDKFASLAGLNESNRDADEEKSDLYHGRIINTNVLGQSDMGFLKVLALFDGLNSPLYDVEGSTFDIQNFMDGAGFALERFNEVSLAHINDLSSKLSERSEGGTMSYSFIDVAKSDPNSFERDLMEMTTPTYWANLDHKLRVIVNAPSFFIMLKQGTAVETKITHVSCFLGLLQ